MAMTGQHDGQGAIAHTIPRGISRRGRTAPGAFVRTALAGRIRLPVCGNGGAAVLKSRAFVSVWVAARSTSITAGTVMHRSKLPLTAGFWGRASDVDAFQRHVGAAVGGSTRAAAYKTA